MNKRCQKLVASVVLCLPVVVAQAHGPARDATHPHVVGDAVPGVVLLASGSPGDDIDRSSVWGGQLQGNLALGSGFSLGLHGLLQNQEYGDIEADRWGVGASLNYYHRVGNARPFVGLKRTYYGELGGSEEALDCLYCSDVNEEYEGGEDYLSLGIIIDRFVMQVDYRLSDRGSDWSESGYDPWGVGPTFYDSFDGVPDPQYTVHIGVAF